MVVPAGRGATGEDDEAGPDPIVGEGLAALDVGGLLGRWFSSACLVMTGGRSMAFSDLDGCPQERAPAGMALTTHDKPGPRHRSA